MEICVANAAHKLAALIEGWKSKYGGMEVGEAQRLRSLEDENRRLKQLSWSSSAATAAPRGPRF